MGKIIYLMLSREALQLNHMLYDTVFIILQYCKAMYKLMQIQQRENIVFVTINYTLQQQRKATTSVNN